MATTTFDVGYSTWNGRFLGLLGLGPRHSSVVVGDDELTVRMGWGFSAVIPRSSIVAVEPDDERVWGWGVHGWGGKWLVNGTSAGLVRLTIDPSVPFRMMFLRLELRLLRVSLADRDAFISALAS